MKNTRVREDGTADPAFKGLYRLGGAAAWGAAVLTLGVMIGYTIYPQPSTVSEWFELFQNSKVVGLLDFWGLEVLMYVMFAVVFLALYFVLKEVDQVWMAIATTFSLVGVAIFLATNNPFSMLSLSDQFAAATTDAQRAMLLAAGQAVLINTGQRVVGGINVGLFLVSVAGLIVSAVMLRGPFFSRLTAYVGILAWMFSLIDYFRQLVTQSVLIALLVILPNALLTLVWFVLIGRKLYMLGRPEREMPPRQA